MPQSKGIHWPLRREVNDYAKGGGSAVIAANIKKILRTAAATPDGAYRGEHPWRPGFGSRVRRLLFATLPEETIRALAQIYVIEDVQRWEPRALLALADVVLFDSGDGRALEITVRFRQDESAPWQTVEVTVAQ